MRFQRRLVNQEHIEGAIEPILVDLRVIELQQIGKRGAPVPILGNVQLARLFLTDRKVKICHR